MPLQVQEHHVLNALSKKLSEKHSFFTHVKNGPTQISEKGQLAIIDGLAIAKSWANTVIRGFEVKVSRSDFLRDQKWMKYLDMCHELSFVCPSGIINPEDVPENVGLLWFNPEKQSLYTKKKAVYRDIDPPLDMLWYIIMHQTESDKHPFFTSRREQLTAWVEDEDRRKLLGWSVSKKLRTIQESNLNYERVLSHEKAMRDAAESRLREVNEILKPYGINIGFYGWNWMEQLRELLQSGGQVNLKQAAEMADSLSKVLHGMMDDGGQ